MFSSFFRFIFCLMFFLSFNSIAQPNCDGQYKLKIEGRPSLPQFYAPLNNYNVQLTDQGSNVNNYPIAVTRHHIIPYNILRDFYNAVVDKRNRLKKYRRFLLSFSGRIPIYIRSSRACCEFSKTNKDEIEGVRLLLLNMGKGKIDSGGQDFPEYYDDFQQFYAWMPWNLFIGPTGHFRSDDPSDQFEENAVYIVNNDLVWKEMRQLYSLMKQYINNPDIRDQESTAQAINKIMTNLSKSRTKPYRLNHGQWVRGHDQGGVPQYHIHTPK